ncbi:MAG: phosphatase PAP2 family protein [Armatimonadetes bacterium]|nr:phosphatase PAP2 family protein [Armatimonadota bacterium]
MRRRTVIALVLAVPGALLVPARCFSGSPPDTAAAQQSPTVVAQAKTGSDVAEWISDTVYPLVVGVPLALYLSGGQHNCDAARHIFNAQVLSQAVVEALKRATDQPRPRDAEATDGFPSGHSAGAWALATVVAHEYPECKWPAYAWAAAVTWARRGARYHTWAQTLAGAFIGWGAARVELSSRRGLFLHTAGDVSEDLAASLGAESEPLSLGQTENDFVLSLSLCTVRF